MRKRTIRIMLLLASVSFLPSISTGQSINSTNEIVLKINEVINKAVELEQFSGSVLVAKEGAILYSKAAGDANKDFDVKNTLNTKFNIGSIGKSFSSTAIMILAQKGLLNINDPVIKYLPDFPFGKEITIHHLLTHTSGLGDYLSNPAYKEKRNRYGSINEILPIIYSDNLLFKNPGEQMVYSNSGAVVVGAIIEYVSGQSYSEFLQQSIFLPLKMYNTSYASPKEVVPFRAVGYTKKMSGGFVNNSLVLNNPSPAGGLLTTVGDLLIFDQALYGNDLLNEEYKKILFTPYKNRYACFWGVFESLNNTVIGHSGGAPGINAWFRRYTNDKYTIIALSNYDNGAESIFGRIQSILFNQNYTLPKLPVGEFLYPLIKNEGVGNIYKKINETLKNNNYEIIDDSEILNSVGYSLLAQDDIDMAIAFFLLNTYLFPDNANAFDSLAEAYLQSGQVDKAIENYEKSVNLNPQNSAAIEILKKLRKQ